MKGPGQRLGLDVRRVWECPACRRRRKTGGETVALRCDCTDNGTWMKLVFGGRPGRPFEQSLIPITAELEPEPRFDDHQTTNHTQ